MKVLGSTQVEKRRDKRMSARPLEIEIDGERYQVGEYSLAGLRVPAWTGGHEPGEWLDAKLFFVDGANSVDQLTKIEVVRVNRRHKTLAARFPDLDGIAYDMLEGWIAGAKRRVMQLGGKDD